jgi:YVTN family beta-propeller protein
MFRPGRRLIMLAAGIALGASLAGTIWMRPLGMFGQATAQAPTPPPPAVTQPDFGPIADVSPEPPEVKPRPGLNVYRATQAGVLSPTVAGLPQRVYVPNSASGTVDVIDPATYKVIAHYWVGAVPHHVAPAWDLSRLYVDAEGSWSLSVIDPRTGTAVQRIEVPDPYNLYFTPDGTRAIVVAERLRRLDFRDPHTFQLIRSVPIPWSGVDHLDFSADGSYLLASTEYAGTLVKVDTVAMQITGFVQVGGLPVDVRLSPDGTVFYVANQGRNGVSIVDPIAMKEIGFLKTGRGAHGLAVSRDTTSLYVTNRLEGTISVIDFLSRTVVATWRIGGSPDMLQLSPDGSQLWTTGRFDGAVYVVDTTSGKLLHTIRVGGQPHGLSYFPNAGRFSLGHNGVYR